MVHAGCVFVAGIYLSRTRISGSFESVQWNACVHRLDLSLYSHRKSFGGMESEPMLTLREKSILLENSSQSKIEPTMLCPAGQRAQVTSNMLFWPLCAFKSVWNLCCLFIYLFRYMLHLGYNHQLHLLLYASSASSYHRMTCGVMVSMSAFLANGCHVW